MDIDPIQDEITARRIHAWELRRLDEVVAKLSVHPIHTPWWLSILVGALLAAAAGYIGIVHQMVLTDRAILQRVAQEQAQDTYLNRDVEDLKRRLLINEGVVQQIPFMAQQLRDVNLKLDRLLERSATDRFPFMSR